MLALISRMGTRLQASATSTYRDLHILALPILVTGELLYQLCPLAVIKLFKNALGSNTRVAPIRFAVKECHDPDHDIEEGIKGGIMRFVAHIHGLNNANGFAALYLKHGGMS